MSYRKGITAFWLGVVGFATVVGVSDVTRLLQCGGVILIDEEPSLEPGDTTETTP